MLLLSKQTLLCFEMLTALETCSLDMKKVDFTEGEAGVCKLPLPRMALLKWAAEMSCGIRAPGRGPSWVSLLGPGPSIGAKGKTQSWSQWAWPHRALPEGARTPCPSPLPNPHNSVLPSAACSLSGTRAVVIRAVFGIPVTSSTLVSSMAAGCLGQRPGQPSLEGAPDPAKATAE